MRKLRNKSNAKSEQDVIKTFSTTQATDVINAAPQKAAALHTSNAVLTYKTIPAYNKQSADYTNQSFAEYSFNQIKTLTTDFGFKQNINDTDLNIYALDDNATALVIMCEHYELTREKTDLELIDIYLNFIQYCLQPNGYFFKYVDIEKKFTDENNGVNLADTTGCAIWALGYLISKKKMLPAETVEKAEAMFVEALAGIKKIHSVNAIAYIIKGLHYRNTRNETIEGVWLIKQYANILVNLYKDVENNNWKWFQSTISLSSSQISEALLCAWLSTGEPAYKQISKTSFDFLLSKVFKNDDSASFLQEEKMFEGKKSTEVNTLIFALNTFHKVFKDDEYLVKIKRSAEWLEWNKFMSI
ncbi:hypothetical protein [Cytophaga hutchinsonii]|jgi:hypothetical protein|uniref:Uncharacterized protein n=1 Tax=Cytophaga hutchinsonii (strain ATCC 33406 / DSM 1761 / CIP 103989 / NBRC 15051 / NCIMB 9469 / D465) TaxID=269798 RepID=A0A6N4SW13_CYTH3|nr:hypothetical protein [Cytophaga hutchinsonii]ABG60775.1 conserved hypothetical protein [Cytophaga hutchinsonii ATCC 33406]SFX71681.1 hypothetical protein SAMN04487930_108101 [Cytophaga hutchinsonii ATCC 33406]